MNNSKISFLIMFAILILQGCNVSKEKKCEKGEEKVFEKCVPISNSIPTPTPTPTPILLESDKYWIYDGERQFTDRELVMMLSAQNCSKVKHFRSIVNPSHVPILKDRYTANNKVAEMYFPACQWDSEKNYSKKAMFVPIRVQKQFSDGTDVWQSFSVFVPEDYDPGNDWNLIYQLHARPDDCDNSRNPPFAIETRDGKNWRVKFKHTQMKCNTTNNDLTKLFSDKWPIAKGGWTHFVIQIRFDWRGDGLAKVWIKDDKNSTSLKILDYSGPLGYNDELAPYDHVSFGYYYGNSSGNDVTLYFDRIILGGPKESLDGMMYNPDASLPTPDSNYPDFVYQTDFENSSDRSGWVGNDNNNVTLSHSSNGLNMSENYVARIDSGGTIKSPSFSSAISYVVFKFRYENALTANVWTTIMKGENNESLCQLKFDYWTPGFIGIYDFTNSTLTYNAGMGADSTIWLQVGYVKGTGNNSKCILKSWNGLTWQGVTVTGGTHTVNAGIIKFGNAQDNTGSYWYYDKFSRFEEEFSGDPNSL